MQASINQEKVWKWERAGWVFTGCLLLTGLLLTLCPGSVSEAIARNVGLRPQRATHTHAPGRLEVLVGPEATAADQVILRLASKELENLEVQKIVPTPVKIRSYGDSYEYVFQVTRQHEPLMVTFHFKGTRIGEMPVAVGLPAGESLAFSRFFYQ
jgi:hypothetical protein